MPQAQPPAQLQRELGSFIISNANKIAIAISALLLFSLLFNVSIKTVFIIPILIFAASFSTFYFNYVSLPLNFELVKLATIVAAAAYGPLQGVAVGVASTFFGKVLIGRIDEKLPLSMLTIAVVAVAAAVFHNASITGLGIALVFMYNVTMLGFSLAMGGDLAWNIPYEVSNFLFNLLIFAKIAPVLLRVIL